MYLGHVGLALAARRVPSGVPLAALCGAAVFLDVVDVLVDVAGLDNTHTAWSHTLLSASGWAVLVGLLGWRWRGVTAGLVLASLVLSHLLTDWLTSHLWLWPGGPRVGLRLYDDRVLDFTVEAAVILAGIWLYRGSLPDGARKGPYPWLIAGVLLVLQAVFDGLGLARTE
nr:hypothetical protein MFMH1_81700 [Myxococcus sp. MH1]